MHRSFAAGILGLSLALSAFAGNEYVARYLPIGTSGSSAALAADVSGNLYIVSRIVQPDSVPQILVTKTDPQGNILASFNFGGDSPTDYLAPSAAAVDPQGNLVIVGSVFASNFPLVSPLMSQQDENPTGFIAKVNPQLTQIVFSTVLGPQTSLSPGQTFINAVALDPAGNIYVTGVTGSSNFPTTPGAYQTTGPPLNATNPLLQWAYAFVSEISADGSKLLYSTFYGSSSTNCVGGFYACMQLHTATVANAIAVDSTGAAVIGGYTVSNDLPTTPGTIAPQCTCAYTPPNSAQPGFLAKFAPGGQKLDWATYVVVNAPATETAANVSINTLALDSDDNVVIGGSTADGFPVTSGALETGFPGDNTAVSDLSPNTSAGLVAKIDSSGSSYLVATYLGQPVYGSPLGVTQLLLDSADNIWLTGGSAPGTLSLPASIPALGSTYSLELAANGASLLGGFTAPAGGMGQGIALTANGSATLGNTGSLALNLPNQPASFAGIMNSWGVQISGSIAPDELVSLFGAGIGPATPMGAQVAGGIVTNSLGGVQVLFNKTPAPLLYAGPNQINAIVPGNVDSQTSTTLEITTPNGTLTGPSLSVVPSEPEVFQSGLGAYLYNQQAPSGGAAVALNQDGSLNSPANPAAPGTIVAVWATGGGVNAPGGIQTDGSTLNTNEFGLLQPVSVLNGLVSGKSLDVLYARNAPGLVLGALQINFQLPSGNLFGANQLTFELQVGDAISSPFSIYVQQ
jgi:uncharacterized protein (TIGR03437 family)